MPALLFARTGDSTKLHWKITTKPTELLLGNVPLTVEKVFKHRTVGLTVAYRPAYQNGGKISTSTTGMFGDYEYQYISNMVVQGLYIGVNSKNYFGRSHFYIDPELFYRRWWCDGKNASFDNVEGYRFSATRTETVNVYGLKILAGYSFVFRKNKDTKIVMDTYCGLGVRCKSWHYDSKNGTVNDVYYTQKTDAGNAILPSVHLGIQFGLGL